jgi:cytidylate kinase
VADYLIFKPAKIISVKRKGSGKMDKIFDYFDTRHRESMLNKPSNGDGPVITISRLTGCDARQVAQNVVDSLNRKIGSEKWKWIDKDIIFAIAKELNTNTERVENFYKGIELSNMSEMIMAFSGGFVSDLRVKKAIKDVVMSMCKEGYIVMVGRGGVSIAHDIPDSLHIRLIAPFYWRVENVMKKNEMDIEAAEEYVVDTDEKRHNLITTFLEKKSVNIDYLFDATINRESFNIAETADIVVSMFEKKIGRQVAERKKKTQIF